MFGGLFRGIKAQRFLIGNQHLGLSIQVEDKNQHEALGKSAQSDFHFQTSYIFILDCLIWQIFVKAFQQ